MIILICGYSRHGKDFLYQKLREGTAYRYYRVISSVANTSFPFPEGKLTRVAFADELKREVAEMLGMTVEELERMKDSPLAHFWPLSVEKPTYRHILIDHAQRLRSQDPYHWVKKVVPTILAHGQETVVVTDFRFPEEFLYLKKLELPVTTIRVHRDDGPKPANDPTERSLDTFQPDYLFIARQEQ